MYPPTVPPISVVIARNSTWSGATDWISASPTGGVVLMATYVVSASITMPSTITTRSIATPARRIKNTAMANTAEIVPPMRTSRPKSASSPRDVPAMLPMLKTRPPKTSSAARPKPAPGSTLLARSCARRPEMPMIRQMLSWIAMSTRTETKMAKANAAPRVTVKVVVWVRKPGPMAEVAIKNIAP